MRTTIDLPDNLMKEAKKKAIEEGITLKQFFTRSLENELKATAMTTEIAPWIKLKGSGSASSLSPEESGFEGYSGPDWNHSVSVNEPDNN